MSSPELEKAGADAGATSDDAVRTDRGPTYWSLVALAKLGAKTFFPLRVEGLEWIPEQGPVVLACNHQSFLDIPLVASCVPRHVSFVARDSLARSRAMAFILRGCGAVLVRRGMADVTALKRMVAHLQADDCLCIFPEGTRSKDGRLGEFRRGALMAARRGRAPVIPVGITGSFEAWPPGQRFPHPHRVRIRFGEPVDPRSEDAREKVRARVAALMESR